VGCGGGWRRNAAFCAAQAAAQNGAKVLMVEARAQGTDGGNSRFTPARFRCVYDGVDDLTAIMPDLTKDESTAPTSAPTRPTSL